MSARAVWKGDLKVGPAAIPVKLYATAEDRKVRFHVLQILKAKPGPGPEIQEGR
jgi:non-homologous end joining protein Ku